MRNATHTHRKTPEKRCEMESSACFCTVQPAGCRIFAGKHRKNRCENKTKVQFRVSKMPAKKSHHPARRADVHAASNNHHNYYCCYYYYYSRRPLLVPTPTAITTTMTSTLSTLSILLTAIIRVAACHHRGLGELLRSHLLSF